MSAVLTLAEVLDQAQPLLTAARGGLRVFPVGQPEATGLDQRTVARCNQVLSWLGHELGLTVPEFVWPAPGRPSSLEVALSTVCAVAPDSWQTLAGMPEQELARGAVRPAGPERRLVGAAGLPPFESFSAGPAGAEAIVVVPPSGVPAELFRPWLTALSADRLVVTYQNPYLFGDWESLPAPSGDFAEEVRFLGALLDGYGIERAHLVGICGGAPTAVAAAAEHGARVASLMVAHPDLNFGAKVPRTPFQNQFQGLLAEAGTDRRRAGEVLGLFLDPNMLYGIPPNLAPFVLYPYGDAELFHRYARLNHSLMAYDVNTAAARLGRRLLIVTSRNDRMTHPAAAHHLHQVVAGSLLFERDAGSHHDILLPDEELFTLLREFLEGTA